MSITAYEQGVYDFQHDKPVSINRSYQYSIRELTEWVRGYRNAMEIKYGKVSTQGTAQAQPAYQVRY